MNISALHPDLCSGCAACMDKCPVDAIHMQEDGTGSRRPVVDEDKCISCKQCKKVCPQLSPFQYAPFEKQAYIGYSHDKQTSWKSSSGGLFVLLAHYILTEKKGVVYGAAMTSVDGAFHCRHIRIEDVKDLHRVQGSKYVQSWADGVYAQVKSDLKEGRTVLFSGTSCQVASLRNFVGENSLLFTVDLVCHGVPGDKLFRDYVEYLERKYKGKVVDMSFRAKDEEAVRKAKTYVLKVTLKDGKGQLVKKSFLRQDSSYFSLFTNRVGYRESCYHCQYASLQKPGDITLGDFRPHPDEVTRYGLKADEHFSTIIVHQEKGLSLLEAVAADCTLVQLPMSEVLKHHLNLQQPSQATDTGKQMYQLYMEGGHSRLQKHIRRVNLKKQMVKRAKSILGKFLHWK